MPWLPVAVMTMSAQPMASSTVLDLEAVHQRLQRVDRVDLGDRDARALRLERLGAALADVAVAADQRGLAADQDVGAAVDAVDQRVPGAVLVVELALGDRVVDVDRRERQLTGGGELVQPQHAGGGLLGDALDRLGDLGPLGLVGLEALAQQVQEHLVLVGVVVLGGRHDAGLLELRAAQHQHGGVTTVVEDHVGGLARPGEHLLGGPPVLLEASRPSTRTPGRPWAPRRCRAGRRRRPRRRGPGWRRCCSDAQRTSAPRATSVSISTAVWIGHVQRAGDPRALERLRRRRIRGAAPSGRASRARRAGSPCGRTRPATGRRP